MQNAEIITTFIFKRQAQIFAELCCSQTLDKAEEWATKNVKKSELDFEAFREEIKKNIHRYKAGLLYKWQKRKKTVNPAPQPPPTIGTSPGDDDGEDPPA